MPDVPDPRPQAPSDPPGPAADGIDGSGESGAALIDRSEIEAAISGLDSATRSFADTFAALERLRGSDPGAGLPEIEGPGDAEAAFEERMREAEIEARAYLSRAKSRADSLVTTMLTAIEEQANEIRVEAETAIRSRWQQVEAEADRHLDDARRVAAGMVAERQERLAELSDGISGRADSLLGGMVDADEVRRQFDNFVAALSRTAAQIAAEAAPAAPGASGEPGEAALLAAIDERRSESGPDSLAA